MESNSFVKVFQLTLGEFAFQLLAEWFAAITQWREKNACYSDNDPSSQVTTGITMMAPPNNQYPEGIRATSVPTVPTPTLPPTTSQTNLTVGQWMMDPSGDFVLILDSNGLTLYRVVTGNPTSGAFQGVAVFGPVGKGGSYFCAQADGNAVVYDSTFPKSLTPTWAANSGSSGSAQYLFVQENGCFVTIQSHGVWGTPL